jgi:hypothetical protein
MMSVIWDVTVQGEGNVACLPLVARSNWRSQPGSQRWRRTFACRRIVGSIAPAVEHRYRQWSRFRVAGVLEGGSLITLVPNVR